MKYVLKVTILPQNLKFYVDWGTTFKVLFTQVRLVESGAMFGRQTSMIRRLLQEERQAEINPYFFNCK
jgi:hypothetical protein